MGGKTQRSKRARKHKKQARGAGLPANLSHPTHIGGSRLDFDTGRIRTAEDIWEHIKKKDKRNAKRKGNA